MIFSQATHRNMYKHSILICFIYIITLTSSAILPKPELTDRFTSYRTYVLRDSDPRYRMNRRFEHLTNNPEDERSIDDTLAAMDRQAMQERRMGRPTEIQLPEGYLEYIISELLDETNETNIRIDNQLYTFEQKINQQYITTRKHQDEFMNNIYYHDIQLQTKIQLVEQASKALLQNVENQIDITYSSWYYPVFGLSIGLFSIIIVAIIIIWKTPKRNYYNFPKSFV